MKEKRQQSAKKPSKVNDRRTAQRPAQAPGGDRRPQAARGERPAARMNGVPQRPKTGAVRGKAPEEKKKRVPAAANSRKKTPQKRGAPVPRSVPGGSVPPKQTRGGAKRHRYHGGNYTLYYMLTGAVIITVLAILANTVLFKCKQIVVSGNARYSAEEIAAASGIALGQNLLHINTHTAEENVAAGLAYIDSAKVKKSFPTGINITVEEAEKWYCIREGGTTAAVSHAGKIVEHTSANGFTVFTGCEPKSVEVGAWFSSETESKSDIPPTIMRAVEAAGIEGVDEVDITDRFSMKMYVDGGRVILELGTASEMESKLVVAKTLIATEISPSESVTILVTDPIQPTVRRNYPEQSEPETSEPDTSGSSDDSDASGTS